MAEGNDLAYEYLVLDRGWPMERFVGHLRETLRRAVVKEPDALAR